MIVNVKGKLVETEDDQGIVVSHGIGGCGGYFGLGHYKLDHTDHKAYCYDKVEFCAHAHCTHSETAMHINVPGYIEPKVPLFQICAVKQDSDLPNVTATIDGSCKHARHMITTMCSVDAECDGGALRNHRDFFETHPEGLITELATIPSHVKPGLYLLLTTVIPIIGSDAHPTHLLLFRIKSII